MHHINCLLCSQEDRISDIGLQADVRESALSVHACFLIKSMSQRDEPVRDVSVKLLTQLKEKFPQVRCFELSSNELCCFEAC